MLPYRATPRGGDRLKARDFKDQSDPELKEALDETRKDLLSARLKMGTNDSSAQPMRIRGLRRDVARIKTVLRERELKGHG